MSNNSPKIRSRRENSMLGCFLLIFVGSMGWLACQLDLRLAIPQMIGVCALCVIALCLMLFLCERGLIRCSVPLILGIALILRLGFVFGPPQLSDDLYRYLWDGQQLRQGYNPYTDSPNVAPPPPGQEALRGMINHPELVTIYPPAAQLLFAVGTLTGGGAGGFKFFLVLLDLLLCGTLLRLLATLNRPPWPAILYAWNPLPVLEIGHSGHIDGVAVLLLLAGMLLLFKTHNRVAPAALAPAVAGGLFAAAVLIKLFPLVFLPALLLLCRGARRFFMGGLTLVALLLCIPFFPELVNGLGTLDLYLRNWEFAGFIFCRLRDLTSGGTARILLGGLFCLAAAGFYLRAWQRNTSAATISASYAVTLVFLLLTTTLHPWYSLYLAALLPLAGGPAGIVLCWSVLLGYQVLTPYAILGQWQEQSWVAAAIVSAPLCARLGLFLTARQARLTSPERLPTESLSPP